MQPATHDTVGMMEGLPIGAVSGERHKVLIVDDSLANRELLRQILEPEGYDVFLVPSGDVAIQVVQRVLPTVVLMDVRMPGGLDGFETCERLKRDPATSNVPVVFITVDDDERTLVRAFAVGGADYITKPFKEREVVARVLAQARLRTLTEALLRKNAELEFEVGRRRQAESQRDRADTRLDAITQQELEKWGLQGFVGQSSKVVRVLEDIRKLQATTTTSILILGESGTGKELIARAIHFGGARGKGPFIAMNCSAIPSELAESTLFGHVQGAFTGAKGSRKGCFELADGGTLFLDEIGDMPLSLQSKLLRVLDDGMVTAVGSTQPRKFVVRVVAATHRNLAREIRLERFRQDLYYRLARFVVYSPALRDRAGDVPLLIRHFIRALGAEIAVESPDISEDAIALLGRYHFPGNIRELKNIVEHGLIRSGGMIEVCDLPPLEPLGLRPMPSAEDAGMGFVSGETSRLALRDEGPVSTRPQARGPEWGVDVRVPSSVDVSLASVVKEAAGSGAGQESEGRVSDVRRELKPSTARRQECDEEGRIRDFLIEFGTMSNAECCELLGLPGERAYALLSRLVQNGRLTRSGERRWTRYRLV